MSKFRRELFGEWDFKPPRPSPGRWSHRKTTQPTMRGERETVFVIVDANGKYVAECEREIDAIHICRFSPDPEGKDAG